jgi:cysteine-rich repeat protein
MLLVACLPAGSAGTSGIEGHGGTGGLGGTGGVGGVGGTGGDGGTAGSGGVGGTGGNSAPVCGDGVCEGAEGCDDGNTTSGDGCSADCVLEDDPEVEPNDTRTSANVLVGTVGIGTGAIDPPTDADWWLVEGELDTVITYTRIGDYGLECGMADEDDTLVNVYDSAGTLLVSNDDLWEDLRCAGLSVQDVGEGPPFYIEVRAGAAQSAPTPIPSYTLIAYR